MNSMKSLLYFNPNFIWHGVHIHPVLWGYSSTLPGLMDPQIGWSHINLCVVDYFELVGGNWTFLIAPRPASASHY
jgi:hypothetical protein